MWQITSSQPPVSGFSVGIMTVLLHKSQRPVSLRPRDVDFCLQYLLLRQDYDLPCPT